MALLKLAVWVGENLDFHTKNDHVLGLFYEFVYKLGC